VITATILFARDEEALVLDRPIILLSILNTERDKAAAIDAGMDDYVTKPYDIQELLARIHAVMRRMPPTGPAPQGPVSGYLEMDFARRRFLVALRDPPVPYREMHVGGSSRAVRPKPEKAPIAILGCVRARCG